MSARRGLCHGLRERGIAIQFQERRRLQAAGPSEQQKDGSPDQRDPNTERNERGSQPGQPPEATVCNLGINFVAPKEAREKRSKYCRQADYPWYTKATLANTR